MFTSYQLSSSSDVTVTPLSFSEQKFVFEIDAGTDVDILKMEIAESDAYLTSSSQTYRSDPYS
jgi:hypothetical protein